MKPDYDPYRCPVCDRSVMRGNNPGRTQAPYREGYLGPWFACPEHGVVKPNYDQRRIAGLPWDDDNHEADLEDKIGEVTDLLRAVMEGRDLDNAVAYLQAVDEEDRRIYLAEHCRTYWSRTDQDEWAVGDDARCPVCGQDWKRFDGVWFLGDTP